MLLQTDKKLSLKVLLAWKRTIIISSLIILLLWLVWSSPTSSNTSAAQHKAQAQARFVMLGTYPPLRCGVGQFASHQVSAAQQAGKAIDVIVLHKSAAEEQNIGVYGPEVKGWYRSDIPQSLDAMVDSLNEQGYEAVILQHEFGMYPRSGLEFAQPLARLRAPLITIIHSPFQFPTPVEFRIVAALLSVSAKLVVLSQLSVGHLAHSYGFPLERLAFVPHGAPSRSSAADCTRAAMAEARKQAYPLELWDVNKRVVLSVGLLHNHKRVSDLVRALPAIVQAHPNTVLLIMGEVNVWFPDLYPQLRKLAQSLNVSDNMWIEQRFLDEHSLANVSRCCCCCCLFLPHFLWLVCGCGAGGDRRRRGGGAVRGLHAGERGAELRGGHGQPRAVHALQLRQGARPSV